MLAVLSEPTTETQALRALLTINGRYPSHRTWERRLKAIPATLPAQIGCFGHYLVALICSWAAHGRASVLDSTPLQARGRVWRKRHREHDEGPHTSIDTGAGWTKSGRRGPAYGWKLHTVTTVAAVWILLAAELAPANVTDNEVAPAFIRELPETKSR